MILNGNENWNTEVNVVLFGAVLGIYMSQNAFNNLLCKYFASGET